MGDPDQDEVGKNSKKKKSISIPRRVSLSWSENRQRQFKILLRLNSLFYFTKFTSIRFETEMAIWFCNNRKGDNV